MHVQRTNMQRTNWNKQPSITPSLPRNIYGWQWEEILTRRMRSRTKFKQTNKDNKIFFVMRLLCRRFQHKTVRLAQETQDGPPVEENRGPTMEQATDNAPL